MYTFFSTGDFGVQLRMAVVIRLQGLPVVAGSADIRRFFTGLNIPDGGVHIIGGENGEAFIIFATDEDARQAMSCSGGFIRDSHIKLFLSSKTEMQTVIEVSRKKCDRGGREKMGGSRRTGAGHSGGSGVGNLSNLVAAIKKGIGKHSYESLTRLAGDFTSSDSRNNNPNNSKSNYNQSRKELLKADNLYLFIRGMPYSATEDDVRTFFSGLQVVDMIMLKTDGQNNGDGLVKFATISDAMKGRQRNREYMGTRFIEVHPSHEVAWIKYGGRVDKKMDSSFNVDHFDHLNKGRFPSSRKKRSRSRSPSRRFAARSRSRSPPRRVAVLSHSQSPPRRVVVRSHSRSPPRWVAARSHSRSPSRRVAGRSRSPFSRCHSPHSKEYYIHLKNLAPTVEKRDLRIFFDELNITNSQITFLKTDDNARKSAFVMFRTEKAYQFALHYHKRVLFHHQVHIFPISKKSVLQIIESPEIERSPERHHHVKGNSNLDTYSGPKTCLYIRNFPFDVTNIEVQKFFAGFNIDDCDIHLLYDDKGIGLGEALVKFSSEDQAQKAESLNRRRFLGTEVLLRCIPEEQMQEFGINVLSTSSEKMQPHAYDRSEHFYPVGSQGPPTKENLKLSSDYRRPAEDFMRSPDRFGGPHFTEFGGEGIPGGFQDGRFMPESNFSGGSDCIKWIKLKNIPFRATPNEILDFFHGYKVIPESLSIQHNQFGLPSGDAILALVNYNEAMAAVNELNDRPIGQRKVRVTLL